MIYRDVSSTPAAAAINTSSNRVLLGVIWGICFGIAGVAFLAAHGVFYFLDFPIAYGEGPIVRDALLLSEGTLFYRHLTSTPPYILSNYTPAFYAILSLPLSVTGVSFIPGRIISLLSGVGVLILVYRLVRIHTGTREAGFLSALLLFISPFSANLALNRVDAVAAFFSVSSVYVIVCSPPLIRRAVLAGALAGAAALTRQTSFIFPLILAFGFYGQKKSGQLSLFFLFSLTFIAGGVAGLLEYASRGAYSFNVITGNLNSWEWDRLLLGVGNLGVEFFAPLIVVSMIIFYRMDNLHVRPLLGWLFLGAVPSFITLAKSGSNLNYLVEMYVVIALISGLVIGGLSRRRANTRIAIILACISVLPLGSKALTFDRLVPTVKHSREKAASFTRAVRRTPGLVLTDDLMGVELLTGKQIVFQSYEVNQLQRRGRWNDSKLRGLIRTGRVSFAAISRPYAAPLLRRERWSKAQWRLLRRCMKRSGRFAGSDVFIIPSENRAPVAVPKAPRRGYFRELSSQRHAG
jgi:hypothetical protein